MDRNQLDFTELRSLVTPFNVQPCITVKTVDKDYYSTLAASTSLIGTPNAFATPSP